MSDSHSHGRSTCYKRFVVRMKKLLFPPSQRKESKFVVRMKKLLWMMPQVEAPDVSPGESVDIQDKAMYTLGCLVIYLVLCGTPLYGVHLQTFSNSVDPLYWFRPVLAARSGTLMELGISPIVTSQFVLQLLAGSKMIKVDQQSKTEKASFQAVQKVVAVLIASGEAVAFIASGVYGDWLHDLGVITSLLILVQLVMSSVILLLLDELIQRGYGVGNGVSIFIATNICTNIMWKTLSPTTIDTVTGVQYEGAVVALFHLLLTRKAMVPALKEAFYRSKLPNLTNLFATVLMLVAVTYVQGFRIDLPVKSQKLRGNQGQTKYPIKLLYTSNIPIILHTALVSNVCFLSQVLTNRFGANVITNLFGKWEHHLGAVSTINTAYNVGNMDYNLATPVGGLVYYMSPPHHLSELIADPIRSAVYIAFIMMTCAAFSLSWINVSGTSSKDVAKQLRDQGLVIRGYREQATNEVLQRYIPTAALLGGAVVAALTVVADLIGSIGSGGSILLAVTIIFEMFELYVREAQAQGLDIPGLKPQYAMG